MTPATTTAAGPSAAHQDVDRLRALVTRATSLDDRLRLHQQPEPAASGSIATSTSGPEVDALLDRWRSLVALDDEDVFVKRLSWDGLDLDRARAVLAVPPRVTELPAWAGTLVEVLDAAAALGATDGSEGDPVDRSLLPGFALPFQDALLPFVLVARQRLTDRVGPLLDLLAPDAVATLEHRLLRRVSDLCAHPLLVAFAVQRQRRQSSLTRLVSTLQGTPGTTEYDRFTAGLLDGGWFELVETYPVLGRLTATVTDLWVDATAEFVQRLAADVDDLGATFHPGTAVGRVTAVGHAVSDAHRHGRSVLSVAFESGLRLVYKPKDIGLEQAYFDLLAWLEEHGSPLPFHRLRIVQRDGYGWSELAETLPCADQDAARRYYRRAGLLLGLLYGTSANDCHYDNLVAHGEHPVLVDMETFMQPQPQAFEDDAAAELLGARAVASEVFRASVLSTGLLPRWLVSKEGRVHDASGLGSVDGQASFDPVPTWAHLNTDAMTLVDEYPVWSPTQNVPVLDGERLSPNDFVEEMVDGLRSMYLLLLEHRDALLAADGPLAAFRRERVRFLVRDTRVYALVLERAQQRQHLRDGAAFSVELDVLTRGLATTAEPSLFWPLHRDEQEALERLDIPMFTAAADSADLDLDHGRTVRDAFTGPGYELVARRLRELSPEDLERQVAYTRASFYSRTATSAEQVTDRATGDDHGHDHDHDPGHDHEAAVPLPAEQLVAAARAIADDLRDKAVRAPDGGTSWIGVAFLPQADRYQLEPTGYDLYSGNAGIALFLAALASVTGAADVRDEASSAMRQVSQMVRAHPERLARGLGIGGAVGTGSLVHALVRTGQLLDDEKMVADAERVATLITPATIEDDQGLDVLVGAAGALLGLLTLHGVVDDDAVLDRARRCGERLLATQVPDGPQRGSWPTLSQTGMTGFSHGAAGIAYALLRLAAVTGDERLVQAARAAVDYERRVFDPVEGNWPDLRTDMLVLTGGEPSFLTQWCHGASGIGLARVAGLPVLDTLEVRADVTAAVDATRRYGTVNVDHLCCGTMGRSELLLSAGLALSDPELVREAGRFAATVVARAQADGGYRVMGRLPRGVTCPSFFQGTAGIGYQLLRTAHPDRLPSVLAWG